MNPPITLSVALRQVAADIDTGQSHNLTPLDDLCIALGDDGHPTVFIDSDTLAAYEWADHLRLRPHPDVQTGKVDFTGVVSGVRWVLKFTPAAYNWTSSVQETTAMMAITQAVPAPSTVSAYDSATFAPTLGSAA